MITITNDEARAIARALYEQADELDLDLERANEREADELEEGTPTTRSLQALYRRHAHELVAQANESDAADGITST